MKIRLKTERSRELANLRRRSSGANSLYWSSKEIKYPSPVIYTRPSPALRRYHRNQPILPSACRPRMKPGSHPARSLSRLLRALQQFQSVGNWLPTKKTPAKNT